MPSPPSPACPLCGDTGPKSLLQTWREYQIFDCPSCAIAFSDPFKNPGPEYYAKFEDLYPHQAQETTDPTTFEYDEGLAFLKRSLPPGASLLDIGCGGGGFLNRARREGFDVTGIDFNETRLRAVREKLGLEKLHAMSLEEFARSRPPESFDAVSLYQVLEHLDRPADWLGHIRNLLKPGGWLIVGVPNRERTFDPLVGPGMEELDNPPNHLTRWTAAAFRAFLEKNGFEVSEVRALPVPRALLALMLRNSLRLGLATKALKTDQLQHVETTERKSGDGRKKIILGLVGIKESILNMAAAIIYPGFRLGCAMFKLQGIVLFAAARRPLR